MKQTYVDQLTDKLVTSSEMTGLPVSSWPPFNYEQAHHKRPPASNQITRFSTNNC